MCVLVHRCASFWADIEADAKATWMMAGVDGQGKGREWRPGYAPAERRGLGRPIGPHFHVP